jgi:aconitate hydratase
MLAAGLVAKRAVEAGLRPPPWVKTSLAPGSRVVADYLQRSGLQAYLDRLGFNVVGYGCTTCAGKSGPLDAGIGNAIDEHGIVAAAVLSGNRNFEGRIHRQVRANYICSPPLVVLYALAGRVDIDLEHDAIATTPAGAPVYLRDLWPARDEIDRLAAEFIRPERFQAVYAQRAEAPELWHELDAPAGARFAWDRASRYMVEPPFLTQRTEGAQEDSLPDTLRQVRVLAAFDDSLTTDHISPSGEIPVDTPAGQYLIACGVERRDFNTYVGRRCNHQVMARATFANIRIRNALVPGIEGGVTRLFPDGRIVPIFDAAESYRASATPVIVLAGREYGTGSSRDWAAKGPALLGVRAVIARSFERIHRANLVGMGIIPLRFAAGEGWRELGLTGSETYELSNLRQGVLRGEGVAVHARSADRDVSFTVVAEVLTNAERRMIENGGMLASVLQHYPGTSEAAADEPSMGMAR